MAERETKHRNMNFKEMGPADGCGSKNITGDCDGSFEILSLVWSINSIY